MATQALEHVEPFRLLESHQSVCAAGASALMAPLLSVGIPAYNRPESLARAVRSALSQTLRDLEVVVSDDASPLPDVGRVAKSLCEVDSRLRFYRQPRNLGHAGNYRWVLEAARGEFFMWLSDDDWLDPAYAQRCLEQLRAEPRRRLVAGRARHYSGGEPVADERQIILSAHRAGARVVAYYAQVSTNGLLFGVTRRTDLLRVGFPDDVGGDWLLVGALAAQGEIHTLRDVHVHRSMDGLGGDPERLAESFGLTGLRARWHHVWVAARVWRHLLRVGPRASSARVVTASLSALALVLRFPLADLLRRAGLAWFERRLVAWAQARRG